MNNPEEHTFDIGIIGGGLAGLSSAILLSKAGYKVALIEKEKYPFHKVCGEYISQESWPFLAYLGLPLEEMQLPKITSLLLTAVNGKAFKTRLPLGGFGISRYLLDSSLAEIAKKSGAHIYENTRVDNVVFESDSHILYASSAKESTILKAKICLGAYGKKTNLDVKWDRSFLSSHDKKLNNYVGIKYHLVADWPDNLIGLHNFKDGYCGISQIEGNKHCLCYMTKANNLRAHHNSIPDLEKNVLSQNPFLKKILSESTRLPEFPIAISQISFNKKTQMQDHAFMIGDAAGMITPLCGNGMSMAMHSGKIVALLINEFLSGRLSRTEMELNYGLQWRRTFAQRLRVGRMLQKFFGSNASSNLLVTSLRAFPFLASPLVKMTHGTEF